MLRPRVIPVLLVRRGGLVKTRRFRDATYVGDPRNAVRIFNEKEVDELVVLDIDATTDQLQPDYGLIREIVSEAFMPVGYGGGIRSVEQAQRLLSLGIEKVVLGTAALEQPQLVSDLACTVGSQSVVACIDIRKRLLGRYEACVRNGRCGSGRDPLEVAIAMQAAGAGELVAQFVDRDGEMQGYDTEMVRRITSKVTVPVIALGGAGRLDDLYQAIGEGGASAAAAGSLFVFHGRHRAVLISYPRPEELDRLWSSAITRDATT